jgi:hypothetical protein
MNGETLGDWLYARLAEMTRVRDTANTSEFYDGNYHDTVIVFPTFSTPEVDGNVVTVEFSGIGPAPGMQVERFNTETEDTEVVFTSGDGTETGFEDTI